MTAVLQEAAEMTITTDLQNIYTDTHVSTETEDMQRQSMQGERVEAEVNQKDDSENEEKEEEEKKESLREESLRMTSWVEVENERRPSAEENGEKVESEPEAEAERDGPEERAPLEAEARNMGEAEKEQTRSVEEELAMMEEKWREQCAINETLKQRLANEEERFRVSHTHTYTFYLTLAELQ